MNFICLFKFRILLIVANLNLVRFSYILKTGSDFPPVYFKTMAPYRSSIIIIMYLWVCCLCPIQNIEKSNPYSEHRKIMLIFRRDSLWRASRICLHAVIIMIILSLISILSHFCKIVLAVEHTISIFMNCLKLAANPTMFKIYGFNAAFCHLRKE